MSYRARLTIARVNNPPATFTGPPADSHQEAEATARTAATHLPDTLYDVADTDAHLLDIVDAHTDIHGREPRTETLAGTAIAAGTDPAPTGHTIDELITHWNTTHPHTRARGGAASLAPYARDPLQLVISDRGHRRLLLGQSTAQPPAGEGAELNDGFTRAIQRLERLERDRATIEPMSAGELRARRELMGLSREDLGPVLGHIDGTGRSVAPKTVQDWEEEDARIPLPVARTMRHMSRLTAQAGDQVASTLRRSTAEPVAVYLNNDQFWQEHPALRPWPARWWRQVCARALDTVPGARLNYT